METQLSIMIVSLRERGRLLSRLLEVLTPQLTDEAELLLTVTGKGETTGSKRNRLMGSAAGRFRCFIDDDDLVAEDYVARILEAIRQNPKADCIGFAGTLRTPSDKIFPVRYTVANRNRMGRFGDSFECFVGHITPIRADILEAVRFEDRTFGEDSRFCQLIMPHCREEVYIDKPMYHYLLRMEV
jgi:hypothetical protein